MSERPEYSGAFHRWADEYRKASEQGTEPLWPSETLIRLFKGKYVPEMPGTYHGQSVLEVGCGNGNNLVFLGTLGLTLSGTEVDASILEITGRSLARAGLDADLRTGTNRQLPWPDETFDYLVSWNVIHYDNTEATIRDAIREYARVLKPGGRFFVSTTGPDHLILENAHTLGAHRYEIGRQNEFRKGEVFFYFDAPNYIEYYFGEVFGDVRVGRTHDRLFSETLDWFIVTGVK